MDGNHSPYDFTSSLARLDEILGQSRGQFEEVSELPDRDRLTFTNGFYGQWCTAVFVDIRDSSSLPAHYQRPRLAKIYRAYISEMVAILNSSDRVREVNIVGDGVWAVYNTPKKRHNDEVFSAAVRANSLVDVLNIKMAAKNYTQPVRVGIGVADGRALMIKAGHKGSGISDVVYMGDVVNRAAKLAAKGSLTATTPPIMVDRSHYAFLNDYNRGFLDYSAAHDCYTGWVVNTAMNEWVRDN
ncbi:adenylate/guanylate cyclase domain-containing protein [Phycicoccus sp. BSK3Z-2]|uniref:Adenylate/guanylate cyclase domain-containing protein n=1 Tax=Phycicoccus avicenniae TaxID=2828860 RepID=A0A941DA62_9MICO|nr:adenylate/guanylate cyclase domain-containing protein [Phycicoccus avicenniae]MBR7744361.1 adenylate/guanylate cyclase domain-containing protein [Phycicoccus avicenniae]